MPGHILFLSSGFKLLHLLSLVSKLCHVYSRIMTRRRAFSRVVTLSNVLACLITRILFSLFRHSWWYIIIHVQSFLRLFMVRLALSRFVILHSFLLHCVRAMSSWFPFSGGRTLSLLVKLCRVVTRSHAFSLFFSWMAALGSFSHAQLPFWYPSTRGQYFSCLFLSRSSLLCFSCF